MRNILLTLSYDGTDFCGWQRQDFKSADGTKPKYVRTVQAEIEKALEKVLKVPTKLYGSGRTDSGVHAQGQAANFFSPIDSMPPEKYVYALNAFLPHDIRINESKEVPEDFNARFSATSRTYRYFIHCGQSPLASEMRYVWPIHRYPDLRVLNEMASHLRGEIDCATFAAAGDQSLSTFRYLDNAVFYPDPTNGERIVFEISANAFLWKMVRSITGSLIAFEKAGRDGDYFKKVLESKNRKMAGATAPAEGLFLWNVAFDGIRRHV